MKQKQKQNLLLIFLITLFTASCATLCCNDKTNSTRNIAYEQYCDSLYYNDPDYYLDVLVETDEFQQYIKNHGAWWE